MAFDDKLPRNSESRCIAMSLRMIRKHAPQVKWVISFADGCSCGDGAIYRASGFVLTGIKKNTSIAVMPDGSKIHEIALKVSPLKPRPQLGGRSYFDITGGAQLIQEVLGSNRREGSTRLPTSIYQVPIPWLGGETHGSDNSVQRYRRGRCRDVQGRAYISGIAPPRVIQCSRGCSSEEERRGTTPEAAVRVRPDRSNRNVKPPQK